MTVLLDPSVITDLQGCQTRLAKKATFEKAVTDIGHLIRNNAIQFALPTVQNKLLEVVARCMTLLKTRYTSSAFWKAGSDLLVECQVRLQRAMNVLACQTHTGHRSWS